MMMVMIAVIVTDRRKAIVKDNTITTPVDSESDEVFTLLYEVKAHIKKK